MVTRTYNIKRNLIFNAIKYVMQLVLQFVLRTVFVYFMGVEYIGINGLFSNIFSFLNLAELGLGSAIVFSMYKPISENDHAKVKSLMNLYKKFYRFIILIILVLGFIITPFIDVFIKDQLTVNLNIYILFVMYLVNTLVGYLCAHKRSLIFAYQRNDLENKLRTICLFAMISLQIVVLIAFKNYYLYFVLSIVFTIIEAIGINYIANKHFSEVMNANPVGLDSSTKKEITKNVAALSMHKIGGAVVCSTDNILISMFCGVAVLGANSNYMLITSAIVSIFDLILYSLKSSVGNLMCCKEKEYVLEKFKLTNFIFSYLSSFTTICLFVLFQPFIKEWTGGGTYLLNISTVILICFSFYLSRMRSNVLMYRDCAGLFWKDKWKPIAEAVINLIVSVVLGKLIGINGIFIGTIVSTLLAPFWIEPLVLYKYYFKNKVSKYFITYIRDFLIMLVCCLCCYFVVTSITIVGIGGLILKFAVCILLSNLLLILFYFRTNQFKQCINILKVFLSKLKKRKICTDEEKR